jgi:signal transduction histidine kinase
VPIELAITVVKGWGFYRFNAVRARHLGPPAADEERNRLLEEAREANRMKDEFLAMLSHELRTPLSAIVGWAHMLRTGGLDEPTVARAIETIDRNAKVQNQLIEDILDVSRIVAGKFHLDMRSVTSCASWRPPSTPCPRWPPSKGVELRQDLAAQVRPCCPAIGDPDRLQQVVWNLLTNAIKFTPKGGAVTVEVRRHDDPGEFEILVRDTGQGIAADFLPHIFERFRQAGTGTRRHGGLGLGLSIVRHIVEMHGGNVMATSGGEGRGSVFTLRLPVVEAGEDGPRLPPVSREEGGLEEAPRLDGVRVLVVEDEADARHLLAAVLQKRGARVFMASSGAERWRCWSASGRTSCSATSPSRTRTGTS